MDVDAVWFERGGELLLGAVEERGPRSLRLVDERGERVRVPTRSILHTLAARVEDGDPRRVRERLVRLRGVDGGEAADPELLLSCLEEGRRYRLSDLAALYFGSAGDGEVARTVAGLVGGSGLTPALTLDEGAFARRPAAEVSRIEAEREREARLRAREASFLAWFRAGRGRAGGLAAPAPEHEEPLGWLRSFALDGERSPVLGPARKLAKELGIPGPDELLLELERAGALPRHVNELCARQGVPTRFPAALEPALAAALARGPTGPERDLVGVPTIAIDDPTTREVDDALSVWEEGGARRVAIHIARVADAVAPGSPLDLEARRRAVSLFFPGETIPMLPWPLTDAYSLAAGQERPALSLVGRLEPDGALADLRFERTRIRVQASLPYEAEPAPAARELLDALQPLAARLRAERGERGAVLFSSPQLRVELDPAGEPAPRVVRQDRPTHLVVSELMVLYNATAAAQLGAAGFPALYREQPRPIEPVAWPPDHPLFPVLVRRVLPASAVATAPGPHRTLGVGAYLQATSPLRRFGDLLAQRQLLALLDGAGPAYPRAEVEAARGELEPLERRARRLEDARDLYLLATWLRARDREAGGRPWLQGHLSRPDERRPFAYLPGLARELLCAPLPRPLELGAAVRLRLNRCSPRRGKIVLEVAEVEEP